MEPRYAGFLRRLGAFAIDALVAYVVLSIAIYVIVPGGRATMRRRTRPRRRG